MQIVMMLTTDRLPESLSRCEQIGVHAYLLKPFGQSELLETLQQNAAGEDRQKQSRVECEMRVPGGISTALRILLAEDSLVNQKLAAGLVKKLGHEVVLANNGREAVDAAQSEDIDLILMDVQMPEMDGIEATKIIRQKERSSGSHVPIIAVTAHVLPEDKEKCRAAGMDGYVTKPIKLETLAAAIENVVPSLATPGDNRG
jgi:CheY-like chemotaxis protein